MLEIFLDEGLRNVDKSSTRIYAQEHANVSLGWASGFEQKSFILIQHTLLNIEVYGGRSLAEEWKTLPDDTRKYWIWKTIQPYVEESHVVEVKSQAYSEGQKQGIRYLREQFRSLLGMP